MKVNYFHVKCYQIVHKYLSTRVVLLCKRNIVLIIKFRSSLQYDLSVGTFSPDGRVFQTEYAQKAVDSSG